MIDTHCHLDVEKFDDDRDDVVARAIAAGVTGILVPAIRPRTWAALAALATRHPIVRIAIGVHPQVVPDVDDRELSTAAPASGTSSSTIQTFVEALEAAIDEHGAVAVGECGLDGATGDRERQEQIFRDHIRAARAMKKPLVVHALHAHDDVIRILREERARDVGGVIHAYSGGADRVPIYRDLGFAFSFAGPVTFANARRPLEAARAVPAELLLVETDAPDQSPEPHRGGRNEPAFLPAVIEGLARARNESPSEIAATTARNASLRFGAW